jgi:hypothetical protein
VSALFCTPLSQANPASLADIRSRAAARASRFVGCLYSGEKITIVVDDSLPVQRYIEDCRVRCSLAVLSVSADAGRHAAVVATAEIE